MNQDILTEVLTQPLAVDPSYVHAYWLALQNFIEGKTKIEGTDLSQAREKAQMYTVQSSAIEMNRWTNLDEVPSGSVAIISLTGPVVKNSQFCGPRGTVDIANDFMRAKANSNIIGAVFYAETGGGMALAVKPLADAMKSFREDKPLVALTGSVIASAGYYLAVYADEIMSEHPRSIVGSIGAMMAFADIKGVLEKQGVKFHEIYATESTLKNKTYNEALKGNYDPIIKTMLDPINQDFISDVKEQRAGRIASNKDIFAGETYMSSVAKELGMIDSHGNLSDAILRVNELSRKPNLKFKQSQNNINMKFSNLAALAANSDPTIEQIDLANGDLTNESITSVTLVAESFITEAANATAAVERLSGELATATEAVKSLGSALEVANASLATANASKTELEGRLAGISGANHNSNGGQSQDQSPDSDASAQALMDNLPHNKRADDNGFGE